MFELIKELTELPGPVGQEGVVLQRVEELWQAEGAATRRTRVGNVLADVGGSGQRLLLVAHADELCYMVRAIDAEGFLWLTTGQGWAPTISNRLAFTIGQPVQVLGREQTVPGVIATATGHLAKLLPELEHLTWNDFWVDTGLSRQQLQACGVTPGTRVIWDAKTVQRGPHVVGKALDDRALLAVQTEVLRRIKSEQLGWQVTLGCTVQEEIGVRGAAALGAAEQFDAALVLEIGLAGDIPSIDQREMPTRLGGGPILVHKDSQIHYDHALTAALERAAVGAGITIQHAVFGSFGSDGIALTMADVPSALVAFPARYTHTPFETAHLADITAMVDWLCAFLMVE